MASIQKRPNGSWRARYRDENGKEHSRHFPYRNAPTPGAKGRRAGDSAQEWLDSVTASIVTGRYVDPDAGRVTLQTFFDDWSQRQVWATGTATAMSLAVRSFDPSVELARLRRSHVEAWVKRMTTDGLAPGTIKTRVNNVRAVLRAAVRDKLIATDPSDGVTLPRLRKAEHAMSIPTPETVGAVLSASEPWMHAYVTLAAFAGLRLGEASAVQVSDIDFLRRTLHVRRQVQRAPGGTIAVTPPKYGSERDVFLADELLEILARHIETQGVRGEEQWIFVGAHGEPPHQNTISYHWRKTLVAAEVEHFKLHDLRHFYASGLIAAGCDVVTVQRALGHAKATTTLSTYSHLWPTAADRTRAAASGLIRSALPSLADSSRTADAGNA
ncbi:site-specific integrase [Herbiconiux sp. L3-i23]|uniref:tyrosine-type recombinase/integrase n=1 Tax=Herbiconiux sp. L3-i23 TaxID=2905871 RepID=UPI00206D2296|nr:site-specific integrase [Herbiconiux sp. L3-i23]BDI23549.1 hypothetical protein L3i23_23250 [Herbiconiux sp. L3-i23]